MFWKRPIKHPAVRLKVKVEKGTADSSEYTFSDSFTVGRDEICDITLSDSIVSREHVQLRFQNGQWTVYDNESSNGTYINGRRIESATLEFPVQITLGKDGPVLSVNRKMPVRAQKTRVQENRSMTQVVQRYFDQLHDGAPVGEHTMMIRQAFQYVQKKQTSRYWIIIGAIATLLVCAVLVVSQQQKQLTRQKQLAQDIFYQMKSLEVQLARVNDPEMREQWKTMHDSYDHYITELGIYKQGMSEEDRLILTVARIFGECEMAMPEGFIAEVRRYIRMWQSTSRYQQAIEHAIGNQYPRHVVQVFLNQNLAPQFFFLALQESDFSIRCCGPPTRYGIAKGVWQFIPATGQEYGLKIGPLVRLRKPDPRDDRCDFIKSTQAAAEYIRFIYTTEAQASGLLVLASYNWGQNNVRGLIRRMPDNPRERNFWKLLENYRDQIPQETYDYVFYIIAAAVIGENPRLFGFDLDNPLSKYEQLFNESLIVID